MSYGAQLSDLKRRVIQYITEKVKEGAFRNEPNDLSIDSDGTGYLKDFSLGKVKLSTLSVERLCNIADKIFFRPLESLAKEEAYIRVESPKAELSAKQSIDMNFEIKKDIPLPGQVFDKSRQTKIQRKGKSTNYRAIPLKEMKVGDCIIIHECTEETIASKYYTTKAAIGQFVELMDTKKKYQVAKTPDLKVGVWRIE